jgi:hypothetical protein
MISVADCDKKVKLKRLNLKKCRRGQPCESQQPRSDALVAPVATNPEESRIGDLPDSIYMRANRIGAYTTQLNSLSDSLLKTQTELINYQHQIDVGSHAGVGHYISEGNHLIQQLTYHTDRTRHKQVLHQHLNLDDLRMLYDHAVHYRNQSGQPHPSHHPFNSSAANNKTHLIESLTNDYALEPMAVLQYYHNLQQNQPP